MNTQPIAANATSSAPQGQPQAQPQEQPQAQPQAQPQNPADNGRSSDRRPAIDARLAQSVRDAHILLDFTCRKGDAPPADLSQVVIDSSQKLDTGTPFSTQEEVSFWTTFAKLTEQVKPVTVESIRFTRPEPKSDITTQSGERLANLSSPAGRGENVLRNYLIAAVATLVVLLVLQVEWAIGTFIYNDAYQVNHYLTQGKTDLLTAQQASEDVKGTPAAQQALIKLHEVQTNTQHDQSWSDVSFVRLQWWNRGVAAYIPPFDLDINKQVNEVSSSVHLDADGLQQLEFTRTELTLQIISNYYLVTLFALLGALTQTLRSLSQQIQCVSLTDNDLYRKRTRVILGIISGVCMAWLYIIAGNGSDPVGENRTPLSSINLLGAFTPWAIAFVSGYSVEIFFTLLERVIAIATHKIKGMDAIASSTKASSSVQASVKAAAPTPPTPVPTPTSAPAPAPAGS